MLSSTELSAIADVVLLIHALIAGFIVLSLPMTFLGAWKNWFWVRNPWFRYAHLAAIGIVVLQAWAGVVCPLTTWEMQLREAAGQPTYSESFVAHWIHSILFYEAPGWVFTLAYSVFGALVGLAWLLVRPRSFGKR